ncbi:hypothetical protein [Shewanella sp. CG12_big_fil_rev_8_21_14_0_65_47_15]|uniref:hypothetical protein n=1 Tax=Shewanella sp. CG12_big_fil_rev_8_21_14_0_65_47_15 TaxID=1975537 RepID=UPI000CA94BA8|nr:hypothetical protein [Shewanella sp. CG12_big_fil_rev_8_21_14_0_65_47_15]PIW61374.1 MAG: hypothetical protein COW15_08135 [Shewanella sp. CG12_big_fil_rev_8_21_14_0_65_47_15]
MALLRKLLRRYRGGPDFSRTYTENFYLGEQFKLSFQLPVCNPPKPPRAKIVNYPLEQANWFEENSSQLWHQKYISIHEVYWYFWPLVQTPFRGEQGDLRLNLILGKVAPNQPSPKHAAELGQALLDQYNGYYNAEPNEETGAGLNTKIINEVEAHSARRATPFTEEEKQELISKKMRNRGYPKITEYEVFNFNQVDWVLYLENEVGVHKYRYATLLKDGWYLMAKFTLTTNMSDNTKPWYKDAEAAIEPMMQQIKLQKLEQLPASDNLLAAP